MRSSVTIQDVAREAGVGPSTVSRVLNGTDYASAATRDRVLEAVSRLGYVPNPTARGLRQAKTFTLGVLLADLANPIYTEFLRGAEHLAEAHGYALLIADGQGSEDAQRRMARSLYERKVDALLLRGPVHPSPELERFATEGIPVFPLLRRVGGRLQIDDPLDEADASSAAFGRLLDLGHRRLLLVSGTSGPLAVRRFGHLQEVIRRAGLQDETVASQRHARGLQETRAAVREAMAGSPPTAFIAGGHIVAPQLLLALKETGLRIPGDISFLSFGDSPWALAHEPPLSVIRYDYYAAGAMGVRALLHQLGVGGVDAPAGSDELKADFVDRASYGPARAPSLSA
jgi:LacI family transcriptional regulator